MPHYLRSDDEKQSEGQKQAWVGKIELCISSSIKSLYLKWDTCVQKDSNN